MFGSEPTVQEITIPEGKKLTVVGDTHGQLQDLFTIFTINGLPSDENMVGGQSGQSGQSGQGGQGGQGGRGVVPACLTWCWCSTCSMATL